MRIRSRERRDIRPQIICERRRIDLKRRCRGRDGRGRVQRAAAGARHHTGGSLVIGIKDGKKWTRATDARLEVKQKRE